MKGYWQLQSLLFVLHRKKCVELSFLEFVMSMSVLCKDRFASINPLFAVF